MMVVSGVLAGLLCFTALVIFKVLKSHNQLARENEFMRMTLVSQYGRTEFNNETLDVPPTGQR